MPHIEKFVGEDGKVWPSATQLTHLLPADWLWAWYRRSVEKSGWQGWLNNNKQSEEGKLIGTQVHERLEHLVKQLPINAYETKAGEYAEALYKTVHPTIEEYIAIEPHLISTKLKLHGTADIIVRRNYRTGLWIGDYKTSYEIDIAHPLQLSIYAFAWNEQNKEQIDQGFIARVDKKSKNLNTKIDEYLDLNQYYPIIQSLREIWSFLHREK